MAMASISFLAWRVKSQTREGAAELQVFSIKTVAYRDFWFSQSGAAEIAKVELASRLFAETQAGPREALFDKIYTRRSQQLRNLLISLARPRGFEPLFSP
jgi:hypothetical protein